MSSIRFLRDFAVCPVNAARIARMTRNDIHYHGTNTTVPTLAEPTPDQRRAFDRIGTPIPLTAA